MFFVKEDLGSFVREFGVARCWLEILGEKSKENRTERLRSTARSPVTSCPISCAETISFDSSVRIDSSPTRCRWWHWHAERRLTSLASNCLTVINSSSTLSDGTVPALRKRASVGDGPSSRSSGASHLMNPSATSTVCDDQWREWGARHDVADNDNGDDEAGGGGGAKSHGGAKPVPAPGTHFTHLLWQHVAFAHDNWFFADEIETSNLRSTGDSIRQKLAPLFVAARQHCGPSREEEIEVLNNRQILSETFVHRHPMNSEDEMKHGRCPGTNRFSRTLSSFERTLNAFR